MDFQNFATFGKQSVGRSARAIRAGYRFGRRVTLVGAAGAVVHMAAWGVVELERDVLRCAESTANAAVERAASTLGYERPRAPFDPLTLRDIASLEARKNGIAMALGRALFTEESHGDCSAVSPKGAVGCMQIMPYNAKRCGLTEKELREAPKNIACGMKLFREDLEATGWDPVAATQRYNGGPSGIDRKTESIEHSRKVMKTMAKDFDV